MFRSRRKPKYTIAGLGVAVTALGWKMLPSSIGAGVLGFGTAHILLGLLDSVRPSLLES